MSDAVLIGNNLAILIAADALARNGVEVTIITDGRRMGGHFYGFSDGDLNFDIGVVFLEWLKLGGPKPSLQTYNPAIRYDWTRFATAGAEWVFAQDPGILIPTPETYIEGRTVPDLIYSNRIDVLRGQTDVLPNIDVDPAKHASQKLIPGAFDTLLYDEAVELNHGAALHARFIAPFMDKLLVGTSKKYLARYHRNVWAPLYYPETLAAEIKGQPHSLKENALYTTTGGYVGHLARVMLQRLEKGGNARILSSPIQSLSYDGTWHAALEDGSKVDAARIALGLANERIASLLNIAPPKPSEALNVQVVLATVKRAAITKPRSIVAIVDPAFKAYRLYDQDYSAGLDPSEHRVSIEANANLLEGVDASETLRGEIQTLMGIENIKDICIVKSLSIKNVLPLPTPDHIADMQDFAIRLAKAAPNALMTGAHGGYGVATLNDQIIQGLMVAEAFA